MTAKHQVPYQAPPFAMNDSSGHAVTLKDFAGKWLVLYFYPKDDTPGCTTEACSLRDARDELAALGAQVVGVSRDEATSHERFVGKYKLNFTLLSDPEHIAMEAYDAWGPKMFGRDGVLRKTFIIDPNGVVQKVYGRVTPLGHGSQVVVDLATLQQQVM